MKVYTTRSGAWDIIKDDKKTLFYLMACMGGILAATILIYGQDLEITFGNALIFTSGNVGNYVIAIPFMAAVVLHRKRHVLRAVISRQDDKDWFAKPTGVSLVLIAAVIFLYGSSTLYSIYYQLYSLVIFLSGATLLVFNYSTFRHVFFAIVLLAFLQPIPGELIGGLAADISWITALILQDLLHAMAIPSLLNTQLGAPSFVLSKQGGQQNTFVIGEPSSGVFSTIGMSLFALFVAYISGGKLWKRTVLFVASFPLFFLLNTLRIGIIMLLWYFFNSDAAEGFHLIGGMMMVTVGTMILLLMGEKIFGIPYIRPRLAIRKCNMCEISSKLREDFCLVCGRPLGKVVPHLRSVTVGSIVLVLVIGSLVLATNNATTAIDSSKGIESLNVREIQGPETVQYVLPKISTYEPVFAYRDQASESILNQDLALAYRYVANDPNLDVNQNTRVYVGIQISNSKHTWENSLVGYPSSVGRPSAKVISLEDIPISPTKTGTFFMYQRPESNSTEAVIYWFERLPFNFGSHFETRNVFIVLWLYTDNLAREQIISNPKDIRGTQDYLLGFARPITAYWQQITSHAISYGFLNDFMNRYIFSLILLIAMPVTAILIYRVLRGGLIDSRYMNLLGEISSQSERTIVLATSQSDQSFRIGKIIATKYRSLLETDIESQKFVEMLRKARDAGFLKNAIETTNDMPFLVWRSRFEKIPKFLFSYFPFLRSDVVSVFKIRIHMKPRNKADEESTEST